MLELNIQLRSNGPLSGPSVHISRDSSRSTSILVDRCRGRGRRRSVDCSFIVAFLKDRTRIHLVRVTTIGAQPILAAALTFRVGENLSGGGSVDLHRVTGGQRIPCTSGGIRLVILIGVCSR